MTGVPGEGVTSLSVSVRVYLSQAERRGQPVQHQAQSLGMWRAQSA